MLLFSDTTLHVVCDISAYSSGFLRGKNQSDHVRLCGLCMGWGEGNKGQGDIGEGIVSW